MKPRKKPQAKASKVLPPVRPVLKMKADLLHEDTLSSEWGAAAATGATVSALGLTWRIKSISYTSCEIGVGIKTAGYLRSYTFELWREL